MRLKVVGLERSAEEGRKRVKKGREGDENKGESERERGERRIKCRDEIRGGDPVPVPVRVFGVSTGGGGREEGKEERREGGREGKKDSHYQEVGSDE